MEKYYILELTLISAQELKKTLKFRRMKTYALVWIDSNVKVGTCIDRVGGVNPTWNDKFLFKVSSEFLYSETSGISVEIFADGIFRDSLVGTVLLLVGNLLRSGSSYIPIRVPSFNAVQIRRPSGRFQGVLNVGASVLLGSEFPAMNGVSSINFRELIEAASKSKAVRRPQSAVNPSLHCDNQALKERHREMETRKHARSSSDAATGSKQVARSGSRVVDDIILNRNAIVVS